MNYAIKILRKARSKLPLPNPEYDQYFCSKKTVFDRVQLFSDLIKDKSSRFLFIGDDDFTSLMVAALLCPDEITVLDIDLGILNIISETASRHNLNISVCHYDVRNPLPEDLFGRFDIVFTDPPYTSQSIKVFLTRARLSIASGNSVCAFCYSDLDMNQESITALPGLLESLSFRITKEYPRFCHYEPSLHILPAEYNLNCPNTEPWFYSHLVTLSPLSPCKPTNINYCNIPLYDYK